MFGVSFSIGSAEMGEQYQGLGFEFKQLLDGGDGAYVVDELLSILLASLTTPSLRGTLKSALITILEEGLRCLARRLSVAFFITN